jgi:hypothetical protein
MADTLFAWTCLAALLLIPYEARTQKSSAGHALLRGMLWGAILSLGAMTKINFLFFVGLVLPALLFIRYRSSGAANCFITFAGFLISSAPSLIYLAKFGRLSLLNAAASSFGSVSMFYKTPFLVFLQETVRTTPGFIVSAGLLVALVFLGIRGRSYVRPADLCALLIVSAFGVVVLMSANRQLRYAFPAIISVPFLLTVMLSPKSEGVSRRFILLITAFVLALLVGAALPTRFRADRQDSLARADAVVAEALRCSDHRLLLATDSAMLNDKLVRVSVAITPQAGSVEVNQLQDSVMSNLPIENDFETIRESDAVVFQQEAPNDLWAFPSFTNARTQNYQQYIEQQSGFAPLKPWGDVTIFSRHRAR